MIFRVTGRKSKVTENPKINPDKKLQKYCWDTTSKKPILYIRDY